VKICEGSQLFRLCIPIQLFDGVETGMQPAGFGSILHLEDMETTLGPDRGQERDEARLEGAPLTPDD
jgi:hypothetical protein